jgi:hypothetical protein
VPAARTCIDCDALIQAGQTTCTECRRERNRERDAHRGTARERGYDHAHDTKRAELLPLAIGTDCPRCGEVMTEDQALDLGHEVAVHDDPSSRADRIEHATCNRGAGAR